MTGVPYKSPWNPSRHEYECAECGCYSPRGEPCWSCEEDRTERVNQKPVDNLPKRG